MAHWKYHLDYGDAVRFWYEPEDEHRQRFWGMVLGFRQPEDYDPDEATSYDDIDLTEWEVRVKSGQERVFVPLADLTDHISREDRDTDIPGLSEGLRLSGGLPHGAGDGERYDFTEGEQADG